MFIAIISMANQRFNIDNQNAEEIVINFKNNNTWKANTKSIVYLIIQHQIHQQLFSTYISRDDDQTMELNETRQSNVATSIEDEDDINYGNLVKQSLMNSFNVNDFIESNISIHGSDDTVEDSAFIFLLIKCCIIGFIILAAIFGNMLVIVSVMQHRKLR